MNFKKIVKLATFQKSTTSNLCPAGPTFLGSSFCKNFGIIRNIAPLTF